MVRLEKIWKNDHTVSYKYFPESETDYGVLVVNIETKELTIEKTNNTYGRNYLFHAFKAIKKFIDDSDYPETFRVAWY